MVTVEGRNVHQTCTPGGSNDRQCLITSLHIHGQEVWRKNCSLFTSTNTYDYNNSQKGKFLSFFFIFLS